MTRLSRIGLLLVLPLGAGPLAACHASGDGPAAAPTTGSVRIDYTVDAGAGPPEQVALDIVARLTPREVRP